MRLGWSSGRVVALLTLVVVAAGCTPSAPRLAAPSHPSVPTQVTAAPAPKKPELAAGASYVAEATGPTVDVYSAPGASSPEMTLPNPWLLNGVSTEPIAQAFLVLSTDPDGWIHVLLPGRPNGSNGWLSPSSARLLVDNYKINVSLGHHQIAVLDDGATIYTGPVAIGAPATPTPTGLFYIRVLLHTTDPNSVYGPYAYGLSSHSEALATFDGGDAEIGIHGNDTASVLGQSVTHGCIRMDNTEITHLATLLPLGTPVDIAT